MSVVLIGVFMVYPVFLALVLSFLCFTSLEAEELRVPEDFSTIQDAIDASSAGDTVLLAPGEYFEALTLSGKPITLRGIGGAQDTVLNGSQFERSIVTIVEEASGGEETHIEGITFTEGQGELHEDELFTTGGAIHTRKGNLTLTHCQFLGNSAQLGGAIAMRYGNVRIIDSVFDGNVATHGFFDGGGAIHQVLGILEASHAIFSNNMALNGGALFLNAVPGTDVIYNSLFFRNRATVNGGGLVITSGNIELVNTTFVQNQAYEEFSTSGGAMRLAHGSSVFLANTIVWDNTPNGVVVSPQVEAVEVSYSNTQDTLWDGEGNMSVDPMFLETDQSDFRLSDGSPCVNGGSDILLPQEIVLDLNGEPRRVGVAIDMGAYEQQVTSACSGDVDHDGVVGFSDLVAVLSEWGLCTGCSEDVDGDGLVGFSDLIVVSSGWGVC